MGLYSVVREAYLRGTLGFRFFTRAHGLSENLEGQKSNISNISVFLRRYYGWSVGKFCVLTFLEALKTTLNDF